jgi:hypothetical protein
MSSPVSEDFENDILAAMERDLTPLVRESTDSLELDRCQLAAMRSFLVEAWFGGTRSAHAQMHERATQRRFDVGMVELEEFEASFRGLMEESANALNLTLPRTVTLWDILTRAWIAGAHSGEAELMAILIEMNSDVAEEALGWLEEQGRETP